ncbi:hypothetical protein NIES4075_25070 [Tolypothrix sp. NIES-4075]|uniref:hypothetical protein n=1 Tax=Tolypothrix sp. NIES-4075 TaxID=2005459 RepID=UPI000B5C4ADF|nr:hypothetical protein [Tolypothrix sp. NIES-4075]GAX41534.1 hypothetical protein NIES4075_25070 [Tolypothrix sp. NIES-4075]
MQIKQFTAKENRANADFLLLQDGVDSQYKHITVGNFLKDLSTGNQSGDVSSNWQIINADFSLSAGDKGLIYSPQDIALTLPATGEIELKRKSPTNKVNLTNLTKINDITLTAGSEVLLAFSKYATKLIYDSAVGWFSIPMEDIIIKRPLSLPSANLIQKFYAFDLALADNTKIATWVDTASGLNATQSDTNQQPIYKTNIFDALPAVSFNSSYLNTDLSYLVNQPYTIAVVESRSTSNQAYFFGMDSSGGNQGLHVGYRGNSEITLAQYSNDLNFGIEAYTNAFKSNIWIFSNSSRGKEIWRNGIKIASNSNTDNLTAGNNGRVGRAQNNNYQGYIGLITTWIGQKSTTEIQDIFTAINNTFAIY